jgi:hypothetical protein
MATHTITLTTTEETLYQKYLALSGLSEATIMASMKKIFTGRIINDINVRGSAKFSASTPAQKIAYLES